MPDWVIDSEALARAENYARYLVPAVFQTWANETLEHVQARPGDTVLDVACGTGVTAFELAPLVGAEGRVVGIDIDTTMLSIAEQIREAREIKNVTLREMSATDLAFSDGVFDRVVCQHAFMFFDDKPRALHEMFRVLSHGGRLVFTVWGERMKIPHESAMADAARACLPQEPPFFGTLFNLGEHGAVERVLRDADIKQYAIVERVQRTAVFASDEVYWLGMAYGRPIASLLATLPPVVVSGIRAETLKRIYPYKAPQGYIFPMEAVVVTVVKP